MAKKKTPKPDPQDEIPEDENDQNPTKSDEPDEPFERPTDEQMAAMTQGSSGHHEHKPAEPTSVCPADQIPAIDPRYSRPALYDDGTAPGDGDPQNGVAPGAMPENVSMVAWARPDPATAQHYPWVEEEGQSVSRTASGQPQAPATTQRPDLPPPEPSGTSERTGERNGGPDAGQRPEGTDAGQA